MPIGTILMYNGAGIANVVSRTVEIGAEGGDTIEMAGWFACNGNASTPNLFYKFIRGGTTPGTLGGSNDAIVVQHNHSGSSGSQSASHSHVINNAGAHAHDIRELQSHALTGSGWASAQAGGSLRGSIIQSDGDHGHTSGNQSASHNHVITVNNEGVSGVNANRPEFYDVIMIIRMS